MGWLTDGSKRPAPVELPIKAASVGLALGPEIRTTATPAAPDAPVDSAKIVSSEEGGEEKDDENEIAERRVK